jgi:Mg/Co/Ni transporter MgtE
MRDIKPVTAISETAPVMEQAPISNSQQRFAAWRKQAKEIWDEHANYTQDQVGTIIREDMIAKKKGVYSVKTIVRYISAVDPRTNRVGRRKLETID